MKLVLILFVKLLLIDILDLDDQTGPIIRQT